MESQRDMKVASSAEDVQQLSRRETQEVNCEVSKSWAVVDQSIIRRMLSYLDNSEALKVGTKALAEPVIAPNEPRCCQHIEHIARQASGEPHQRLFQIFSRQGAKEILVASVERWEEHPRMLKVLERECLDFSEAIEQLSEKQELLATLMESKKCLQKGAPERFQEQIFQELKERS